MVTSSASAKLVRRLMLSISLALIAVGRVEAVDYYRSDYCEELRAGSPHTVKVLAVPSNTRHYGGYYVGGGSMFLAGGPRPLHEGTWGWDYGGLFKNTWVKLGWNCGNRPQGGTGAYSPEHHRHH